MKSSPFALQKWMRLFRDWDVLAQGLLCTLEVALLALALALVLGVVFGVFSAGRSKALRGVSRVYVEFFQNTPLVIQVVFLYYGLPFLGIVLDKFTIGVVGVGIYTGAYISEVVRTGIEAVPRGQWEAARAQGFTYLQTMGWIILPQTVGMILPPLTNQAVNLIKNTSVLAMIAGGDLMYHADSWASSYMCYGPAYVTTGLLYFALCFPLATFARRLEKKLGQKSSPAPVSAVSAPQRVQMSAAVLAAEGGND